MVGVGSCMGTSVGAGGAGVWRTCLRVCDSKPEIDAQRVGTSCGRTEHLALRKIRYSSSRTSMRENGGMPMNSVEEIS